MFVILTSALRFGESIIDIIAHITEKHTHKEACLYLLIHSETLLHIHSHPLVYPDPLPHPLECTHGVQREGVCVLGGVESACELSDFRLL